MRSTWILDQLADRIAKGEQQKEQRHYAQNKMEQQQNIYKKHEEKAKGEIIQMIH